jgi:hypothetical protein
LSAGEVTLARSVFGDEVDYSAVRIRRRKWFPFQPRKTVMAPRGHIHFHPGGELYCDDFAQQPIGLQGLFIHEMTHVWQVQDKGSWYLVLHRHPWCRYDYSLKPGWPLDRYGIEQQAEIIRHAFLLRKGLRVAGAPSKVAYDLLVNFPGANG